MVMMRNRESGMVHVTDEQSSPARSLCGVVVRAYWTYEGRLDPGTRFGDAQDLSECGNCAARLRKAARGDK